MLLTCLKEIYLERWVFSTQTWLNLYRNRTANFVRHYCHTNYLGVLCRVNVLYSMGFKYGHFIVIFFLTSRHAMQRGAMKITVQNFYRKNTETRF